EDYQSPWSAAARRRFVISTNRETYKTKLCLAHPTNCEKKSVAQKLSTLTKQKGPTNSAGPITYLFKLQISFVARHVATLESCAASFELCATAISKCQPPR